MSIKEIEKAITNLSADDFVELSKWFADYEEKIWDEQIEHDLDKGRLDALLNEAEDEYKAGKAESL